MLPNLAENLKLRASTILWILLTAVISSIGIPLLLILIEDSNAFQSLKQGKPIDSIIAILLMPSLSIPVFAFALIVLSLLFNLFLFKRMNLYFSATEKFSELFYKTSLKLSKAKGKPVVVNFNKSKLTIDAKDINSGFIDSL